MSWPPSELWRQGVQYVDQDDRLQLERVGSTLPSGVWEQSQLQLERAHPALRPDGAVLQLDRLQLDRV
jgi:hypothetical protein